MKKLLNITFLFLFTSIIYGQIPSYYNDVDLTKTGNDLFLELSTKITSTHIDIPYTSSSTDTWDVLKMTDVDPDISGNVLLIYGFDDADGDSTTDRTRDNTLQDSGGGTGVWNREHVFAKSLASPSLETGSPGPGTDVHNLRPADSQRNSTRSSRLFSDGSGQESYITSNGGWYPGDEWKGDVARIVMYMYARYHGAGNQISETSCLPYNVGFGNTLTIDPNMVDLFLAWNVEDPVSDFERQRNPVTEGIQGNRNPFIDNPYLATIIWGGLEAEDLWWSTGSSDDEAPTAPTNLAASNITDESFDVSWTASTDNEGVYDYFVYLNGVYLQSTVTTSTPIVNLSQNTTYNITIKARDAASNLSEFSTILSTTTLEGPKMLFEEYFEDCDNFNFFAYNEASDMNWECNDGMFGENNSGSYGINGYQEDVPSKDWLVTKTPINFDTDTGEKISFYTDAAYGSSELELVYSSNYDGASNPGNYTWTPVPGINIPTHSNGSSTEEVYMFSDVDISTITGSVYFAFKYYSNGEPTRWTVDSFEITADNDNTDIDGDGVLNVDDLCSNTPTGEVVDANGCSNGQLDDDNDGVQNSLDVCAATPTGEAVNADGCSDSQLDDDSDGVMNNVDVCPNTPTGETVNVDGCWTGELDDDNDGVQNSLDVCAATPTGEVVDADGCSDSQLDDDSDGVMNNLDVCPNTPTGETVNVDGCWIGELDDDNDGVQNSLDVCTATPIGEAVNADGCWTGELDDDNDGVQNSIDVCTATPTGEVVNADGCWTGELDDDNDGVQNSLDVCLTTTPGATVDATGCFALVSDNFNVEVISETCPDEDNGQILISAIEDYTYTTTINGIPSESFTKNDDFKVDTLEPGIYNLCISVAGQTFTQCFDVEVIEGEVVVADATVNFNKAEIEIKA
ncbi:MAG: hypothetical protein GQ540_09420, partial [Lutibacter sp.]|uniref:endonuclease n=1 Tax=Lutibacter sp. TaxID=1925666 RepID=UPI0019DF9877